MGLDGHLFVVHGRLESLVHDVAVVPVGGEFAFSDYWNDVVGPAATLPTGWTGRGFGRVEGAPEPVWAVSVGPPGETDPYDVVLGRVEGALRQMGAGVRDGEPRKLVRGSGTLPLVALPVIGIGLGGHGRDRGAVLRRLVDRLEFLAPELRLDIALITPDPAVYAAAQYARRDRASDLPKKLEEHARDLGLESRRGGLALLLGAGVSVAAGLPTWGTLVTRLGQDVKLPPVNRGTPLSPLDQAELVQTYSRGTFKARVVEIVGSKRRPSLLHAMLAGLDSREVVTTNYDLLYEVAVEATGREIDSIMPWDPAQGADRWVLKLHGDVDHPRDIVLTRRHMVNYDSTSRPSGALLQTLLLTRRLLVVGTSMTDDNVLRLAHEVLQYRKHNRVKGALGFVLDAGDDLARGRLWQDSLTWLPVGMEAGCDGPRAVELFLDRVALHASRDSSWLLDERFEGLLNDDRDRRLAAQGRALAAALEERASDHSPWAPLQQVFKSLGAGGAI